MNRDGRIGKNEFAQAFTQMGVQLTGSQLEELWHSINTDKDGSISYIEFVNYFKQSVRSAQTRNVVQEAEREVSSARQEFAFGERRNTAVMEAREQAALNKAERYQARMQSLESALAETEKQLTSLESKHLDVTRKYHDLRNQEVELRQQIQGSISKAESERLRQNNEILQKELAEARAAMHTYKSLVSVSADHARALQLTIERRKDEVVTFQEAIRELQAEHQDKATVGKLFHQVMVSRWSEATANRKYDSILNETRTLRLDVFKLENELMEKEQSLYSVQQVLTEKVAEYEYKLSDLRSRAQSSLSLERAEELVAQIRELGNKKTELEDLNRQIRYELYDLKDTREVVEQMRKEAQELYDLIKTGSPDELSDRLVQLAERMSQVRLSELKAKRECNLAKENEEYFSRLHKGDQETIRNFESEIAIWESTLAKKEEMWRKRDDERQKMLLNPRFQAAPTEGGYQRPIQAEITRKDEEMQVLKEQLRRAEAGLNARDQQIEHLTQIRNEAEMMGTSLTHFSPKGGLLPEELRQVYDEQEIDHLAQAAGATIATLQDMINHKNNQLDRKEEIINKLKQDIIQNQNEAAAEISRLSRELEDRTHNLMGNLSTAIELGQQYTTRVPRYNADMDALLHDKDQRFHQLAASYKAAVEARDNAEARLKELRYQYDNVQYELDMLKSKNSQESVKKEITNLRKQLNIKNKELENVRASLRSLKNDLINAAETTQTKEREFEEKLIKEGSDNTLIAQRIKKAENRINNLTKQLKESRDECTKLKEEKINMAERETKLREENQNLRDNQYRKQETFDKMTRELKELKDRARAQSREPVREGQETKQMREQIVKLETDKQRLTQRVKQLKDMPPELEPKSESVIRRFGTVLRNKAISVSSLGTSDKITLQMLGRAIKERSLGFNDEEIDIICNAGITLAQTSVKVRNQEQRGISLKVLDKKVRQILTTPPRPIYSESSSQIQMIERGRDSSTEVKKLEIKADALSKQLAENIRELEQTKKELLHWREMANRFEQEKMQLENRIQPAGFGEAQRQAENIESVEQLRGEIYELQQLNSTLEYNIQVNLQAQIKSFQTDLQNLTNENRKVRLENANLQAQVQQLKQGRISSAQVIREEEFYDRDMRISKLEEENNNLSSNYKQVSDQLIETEKQILELRFEKEGFNLQIQRLQRRVRELEQYKQLIRKENIHEHHDEMSRVIDTSQMDFRTQISVGPGQSNKEFEHQVDALRKANERLRIENEHLKRKATSPIKQLDTSAFEKGYKDKISQLETEVKELRSREEINKDLENKLKLVNEANEQLRAEIERDRSMVERAEANYRQVHRQYTSIMTENERLNRIIKEIQGY